jgi:ABC-type branched-subunit amino acid transport system substrate-binding protein
VQVRSTASGLPGGLDGLQSTGGTAQQPGGAAGPGGTGGSGGSTGGTTGAVPGTTGGAALPGAGTSTGGASASGSGVVPSVVPRTSGPVSVGFLVADDNFDSMIGSVGISGLAIGSQRQQGQAMVDDINAHGGLLGRKIAPVYHVVKTSDTNAATSDQAACDDFTQDHKVQFVISILGDTGGSALLASCLAKRGVTFVNDDYPQDEAFARSVAGYFFNPSDWMLDRLMRTQTKALAEQGFFTGSKKVGILLYDKAVSKRVLKDVVIPGLAAVGVKDPVYAAIAAADYFNEQGTVLKFQAEGVDRILTIAFSPLAFMATAEAQQYRPRYSVYTTSAPGALLQTAAPKAQLRGAMGFGWSPQYDVDSAHNPGPVTPAETRCLAIMKKAGVDTSQATTRALVLWFCDAAWFVQAAVNRSGDVSAKGLAAGARILTGYQSPGTWRTDLSSGRPDGVSAYRDLAYRDDCSCFVYTSGLKPATS